MTEINGIVLTRSIAEALFGSTREAMGKTLELDHEDPFLVTGVLEDIPATSSLQFEFLLSWELYKKENEWVNTWGNNGPTTIALLREDADPSFVNEKIADFIKKRNDESNVTLFLKSYTERYLYGRYENGKEAGGRIEYVRLFSIIALFILAIACINFMNLSTARASRRSKEVGVKKAVGAEKQYLIRQFLGESTLISLLSLFLAILLVITFLPQFNIITEKEISLGFDPKIWAAILGLTLFTGLLAGSYPALYLSSFKPVEVLKGRISNSWGELWARRGLVVFQFTLSMILIVAVLVIYRQIQFVQTKNLGYEKENLIYFSREGRTSEQHETFLYEAGQLPGIASISSIAHDLIGRQNNTSGLDWDGKNPDDLILFENVRVNYGLLETIGVELAEGRFFSKDYGADSSKIIFNEKAIEIMGFEDPIGKKITLWEEYELEIIGVVKDFHFQSLHESMNPLFFKLDTELPWNIMARLEKGREKEAIDNLTAFYESYNPGFSLDFEFIDEQYAQQYKAEQLVGTLSKYFAGFAILISCLGLLGLAAYTADRKKKEIGIRKVLGASTQQIVLLLTGDFTRLVLISILIGLPLSYFLTHNWLEQFAYKIELGGWFFFLAGLLTLFISWLTVSSQAYRSAQIDPQECLKSE